MLNIYSVLCTPILRRVFGVEPGGRGHKVSYLDRNFFWKMTFSKKYKVFVGARGGHLNKMLEIIKLTLDNAEATNKQK